MKKLRKLTILAGLLTLCACASYRDGDKDKKVDCSTVRCAACPTGQHPILQPPDCCHCVPD
jgi:hypothetical protein